MKTDIQQIWKHVEWIASEPRFAETERLEECRHYCEQQLSAAGWQIRREPFRAMDGVQYERSGINLVCHHPHLPSGDRVFVLGAHLDSREDTPGADDNASAVAVLLEIARLAGAAAAAGEFFDSAISLELVVFDLEEHGMLGGAWHAAECRRQERSLHGMVSLEMLGYCDSRPGSQHFPPEIAGMYPDTGDFIGIVGNQNSGDLIAQFSRAFARVSQLKHESLQVPDNGRPLAATRLSDHSPFWDEGYAALMITDTSFLRNPHYHEPSDTPDTLDREFLHRVAEGVWEATVDLLS